MCCTYLSGEAQQILAGLVEETQLPLFGGRVRLSKPLLSHGSCSKLLLSWWKETWLAVTEPCELDSEQSLCLVKQLPAEH